MLSSNTQVSSITNPPIIYPRMFPIALTYAIECLFKPMHALPDVKEQVNEEAKLKNPNGENMLSTVS